MMTIAEVAAELSVSWGTVRSLIGRGELQAIRVGSQYRLLPLDVAQYLARQSVAARPEPKPAAKLRPEPVRHLTANAEEA
jgi:excisionase family DNA binding protein